MVALHSQKNHTDWQTEIKAEELSNLCATVSDHILIMVSDYLPNFCKMAYSKYLQGGEGLGKLSFLKESLLEMYGISLQLTVRNKINCYHLGQMEDVSHLRCSILLLIQCGEYIIIK